jgi:DNA repair exonuclease SbcCD ATPase subunit
MNRLEALQHQLGVNAEDIVRATRALEFAQRRKKSLEEQLVHATSETPVFSDRNATCKTCGADVRTEALFTAHYVITDWRYPNLGECPTKNVSL